MRILLPDAAGVPAPYALTGTPIAPPREPKFNRVAYAAGHVVADPLAMVDPWVSPAIDWDSTLAYRRHLWSMGFAVAEAMDTAQRGMGFDWENARELIRRSIAEAKTVPGAALACGAGTDQLAAGPHDLDAVLRAYEEQVGYIEGLGGKAIVMASRALEASAKSADDYFSVYDRLLGQASEKVILHWLGEMFDPALAGYWGSDAFEPALDTVLAIIAAHPGKVEGIKISLLDVGKEVALRERLPDGVKMFTGDDFNYPELIEGDGGKHSHALLGIFAAIGPAASAALDRLAKGDAPAYRALMAPTVPLARTIFEAPTANYKAGIVFLAWLNGHQDHFCMVSGMQSARSIAHYSQVFRLADKAGLLRDPDKAIRRMRALLATAGVT